MALTLLCILLIHILLVRYVLRDKDRLLLKIVGIIKQNIAFRL